MTTSREIDLVRARVCYLVRGLWRRVNFDAIPQARRRNLSSELVEQLFPLAVSERSTHGWVRALCARFDIDLTTSDRSPYPASSIVPEVFIHGVPGEEVSRIGDVPHRRVRWDQLVRLIPFQALRVVLHDEAAFVATFAMAESSAVDTECFPISQQAETPKWKPTLPRTIIEPRSLRATWTLVSPLVHGHDQKTGNVQLFRRQRSVDPTNGTVNLVPFVSGNAVRGAWRDQLFSRLLHLVGLTFREMPPQRAHALLAGGTIEAGADSAKVDVGLRRRAREICPAWDLIAGCIDGQIMKGLLSVMDAELVCQENAWKLHHVLAPELSFDDFRGSLKLADDLTQLRLMTRQEHRDIERAHPDKSLQMIVNVEAVLPGAQLFHRFAIHGLEAASELARSCMADLLEEFRDVGKAGAKHASGFGAIAFDGYAGADGMTLPDRSIYLEWVERTATEIRSWLLGEWETPTAASEENEEAPKKRGRKAKAAPAVGESESF